MFHGLIFFNKLEFCILKSLYCEKFRKYANVEQHNALSELITCSTKDLSSIFSQDLSSL